MKAGTDGHSTGPNPPYLSLSSFSLMFPIIKGSS